jgi:uncharacterized protein
MRTCANALRLCAETDPAAPETKRAKLALTQASEAGFFEGYASLFSVVDSGGDLVMPAAFAASLRKRGPAGVKMLWQHKSSEPIGVWTEIAEDARGLKVKGQLDLSVARAREALSLLRSGAVDGLSIGFRTRRATSDKQNGVRRLLEVDLWEISIVTFPMLAQARIEAVKRRRPLRSTPIDALTMKLARLRAHRAAENFETKLRLLSPMLERRYSPEQPRVPAGSSQGGRWTSGGEAGDQSAFNVDPNVSSDASSFRTPAADSGLIDLLEEQGGDHGGHAYSDHVGKTREYLIRQTEDSRRQYGRIGVWKDRVGSFSSLEAGNKLVNATLAQNFIPVDDVAVGRRSRATIESWFGAPTGYESYAPTFHSRPTIRETWGVRVVLRHDPKSPRGFRVFTSFPINRSE